MEYMSLMEQALGKPFSITNEMDVTYAEIEGEDPIPLVGSSQYYPAQFASILRERGLKIPFDVSRCPKMIVDMRTPVPKMLQLGIVLCSPFAVAQVPTYTRNTRKFMYTQSNSNTHDVDLIVHIVDYGSAEKRITSSRLYSNMHGYGVQTIDTPVWLNHINSVYDSVKNPTNRHYWEHLGDTKPIYDGHNLFITNRKHIYIRDKFDKWRLQPGPVGLNLELGAYGLATEELTMFLHMGGKIEDDE